MKLCLVIFYRVNIFSHSFLILLEMILIFFTVRRIITMHKYYKRLHAYKDAPLKLREPVLHLIKRVLHNILILNILMMWVVWLKT